MTSTEDAIANLRYWAEVVAYRLEAADEMVKKAEERSVEAEEYAAEGWAWVDTCLSAGGWKDVFDALDAERATRES